MAPWPSILRTRPDLRIVQRVPYRRKTPQKGWAPLPQIDFKVQDKEGIKLTDAVDLHFNGLDGRDDPMFTHESIGNFVQLCLMNVRGFCDGISVAIQSHCLISSGDARASHPTNKDRYD